MNLPELTADELKALDSIDMTPILGTQAEQLQFAMNKAVEFMRKLKIAETSQKVAWNEHRAAEKERDDLKKLLRFVMSSGDTLGLKQDKTYTIVLNEKLFKAVCEAIN